MSDGTALIYLYDESFYGLLCCIFESYTKKEIPTAILPQSSTQATFFKTKEIKTIDQNALRVLSSLEKMGKDIKRLIQTAFLFDEDEKADVIFRFIRLCYEKGPYAYNMLGHEVVSKIHDLEKSVINEAHLLKEFLRFAEVNDMLVAFIDPKHYVLPLMQEHFCARYNGERFLIFDKTHKMAVVYQPYEAKIIQLDDIKLDEYTKDEKQFQTLWSGYFKAIAIKERTNARCQMGHMPKRFWRNMLETQATTASLEKARQDIGELPPARLPHLMLEDDSQNTRLTEKTS